jgi:hexosaminidase
MMSFNPYGCVRATRSGDGHQHGAELDPDKAKMLLGGQACLFVEQTDETNLECVVWPRAAAVADLFWTGDAVGGGYPRGEHGLFAVG